MKIYFLPKVAIYHLYGRSSIGTDVRQTIFYESYYQYFRKHHGLFESIIVRVLIFLGEIMRIAGIQIKYFPLSNGLSTYSKKMMSSFKLVLWALGIKSSFKNVNRPHG